VFVLAQVRFSPIAKMADFVPQIQESLRKKGFPGFELRKIQEFTLGSAPQVSQSLRWFFSNRDKTASVILSTDFVVLATSVYKHFEDFIASFEKALVAVRDASAPSFASRVGLRYVDLIRPAEGERLDEYLQPGLGGIRAEDIEAESVLHQFHLRARTQAGTLSLRLWQNKEGTVLPPDMAGDEIAFRIQSPQPGELLTILDLDHYTETERDFSPDLQLADLWTLHDGTDLAFRKIVTGKALERWGNEPPPAN